MHEERHAQKDLRVSLGLKLSPDRQQRTEEAPQCTRNHNQNIFTDGQENIKDKILGDKKMIYLFYCLARDYQE